MVMTDERSGFGIFLTFSGQCAQALKYYKKCFGGTLSMQTMNLDKRMQDVVVSATLTNNYFKLVATDLGDGGIVIGNNISILVECTSFSERERLTSFLSADNNAYRQNDDRLISVLDRYSVNWILSIK
jgi:PhnB protein